MFKVLIWYLVVGGLLPVVYLVVAGTTMLGFVEATKQQVLEMLPPPPVGSLDTHMHDSYIATGPLRMTWYPRVWALALAGLGATFTTVALVFQLHVPTR